MKLNMGCGHDKLPDWVNVDVSPTCEPDIVCDLEVFPWPWKNDSIDNVRFIHCLEHLGETLPTFFGMIKELYRVCKDGAEIRIHVPHPRHDTFINDPTHVRIITPNTLALFDREANDEWQRTGVANTPLAHQLNIDFRITSATSILSEPYSSRFGNGELSLDAINNMGRELNNVFLEYRMVMVARKQPE